MKKCQTCGGMITGLMCLNPNCGIPKTAKRPANGYATFEQWKGEVNRIVEATVGMSCDDLPDYAYQNAWDSNRAPIKVARDVIRENL